MNLRYITCSEVNEHVKPTDAMALLKKSPLIELGIQSSGRVMEIGTPRHQWMEMMLRMSNQEQRPLNIALHLNYDWCTEFCNAQFPKEIEKYIFAKHKRTDFPMFQRWQLNIGDNTGKIDADVIASVISGFSDREFIFPYNDRTVSFVSKLKETGAKFSLLFDSSYGVGKSPESWQAPVFTGVPQGYSGGMSGDNVYGNLTKIFKLVEKDRDIWIDAEGKLLRPGRIMDMTLANNYIDKALLWIRENNR
jgi:hypothetical protein